jgi:peptide/nickel transport system substrate-binding protein
MSSSRFNNTLSSADRLRADGLLREAEAMGDCAVVPILFAHCYWPHASRERNWLPYPVLNGDLANVWLSNPIGGHESDRR